MRAFRSLLRGLLATMCLGACAVRAPAPAPAPKSLSVTLEAPPERRATPPIALTSADGKDLVLESVSAKSIIAGPLAFTQLELVFKNPEPRTIEGRFRIALPSGASVSRFAMKIGDAWQEGEMVEKAAATRIYEDFLHRRVDPALLEQGAGNSFSARVFPIPASGTKALIVSYSQALEGGHTTLVPLAGSPPIHDLRVEVAKADAATEPADANQVFVKTDFRPDGDFVLDPKLASVDGLRSDDMVVVRVPATTLGARDPLGGAVFLLDTSASRALDVQAQIDTLQQIAARLGQSRVIVIAFDQTTSVVFDGSADTLARTRLSLPRAMGASNLQHALAAAGKAARSRGLERVVVLGDGVVTAGAEGKALSTTAQDLARDGVQRLDVVAFGGIRDDQRMGTLVTAGLPRDGMVIDSAQPVKVVWHRLNSATQSGVPIAVDGASWWWPKTLDAVQPGDDVVVHARLEPTARLVVRVDDHVVGGLRVSRAAEPLVARSLARAQIASLLEEEQRHGTSDRRRAAIVSLSTRHRVLSPYTSLLVLESQNDYDRYHLERDALADILEVKNGRLAVVQRTPEGFPIDEAPSQRDDGELVQVEPAERAPGRQASPPRPPPPPRSTDDARVAQVEPAPESAPGQLGHGSGGIPLGQGQGFGSGTPRVSGHHANAPRLRMGTTQVSGRLPPEIIQRVVRANFGALRGCYETALRSRADLTGRIVTRFLINRQGKVSSAAAEEALSAPAPDFARCIEGVFLSLKFPPPANGIITVSYPVVFTPSGHAAPAGPAVGPTPRNRIDSPTSWSAPAIAQPLEGKLLIVMNHIQSGAPERALKVASRWQDDEPGSLLAWVALGEAFEALGDFASAARAYGSIIDLFPARADLRRYAGQRLDRVDTPAARALAIDTYRQAKAQRPDHPTSHRLLAYALLRSGRHEQAFAALATGLTSCTGRYAHAAEVLRRDLGLVAASWIRARPDDRAIVEARLLKNYATLPTAPSTQFVLNWETDTNDVDMHVYDNEGEHAFYSNLRLQSGGHLHRDVTTGFGPELFTIDGPRPSSGYRLQAHYYARGPMGYGMGTLQVVEHDGHGKLTIDHRPFVVMVDQAFVNLGTVGKWKASAGEQANAASPAAPSGG